MATGAVLLLLGTALASARALLDTETPRVFLGDPGGAFGTSVVTFGDGGILVGAPLERGGPDELGALYRCWFGSGKCQKVPVTGPPGAANASLGLALAAGEGGVLACGPTSPQSCGVNVHLNGFCVHLDPELRPRRRLPDTFPECPKRPLDIAFLVDGSGSIAAHDFDTMKVFIAAVMRRFGRADAQFSLTQFSLSVVDHFDFATFRKFPDPAELLRDVRQLGSTTRTATAIRTVLRRMFVPGRGARAGADRVLVVVTDGQKFGDTLDYSDVIPEAEAMAVTRYAIGVGGAFASPAAQAELRSIASEPWADHVFRVDNFEALRDIESHLQDKIFAIEGTHSARSSSFQLEMAQEGFSAAVTNAGLVLGAVGAFDWSGGAFVHGGGGAATFVNGSGDSDGDMRDAYLGYSVASLSLGRSPVLALGAPRFRHLGRVLLVTPGSPGGHLGSPGVTWKVLAQATGPQVGSYFGAALLALSSPESRDSPGSGGRGPGGRGSGGRGQGDAPGAGEAPQVLLVGAPNFHGGGSGGRVEICQVRLQEPHLRCGRALRGLPGQPQGRFGASLAHLGDLDGDTWPEVAVGAPLEDGGGGAVYLYRGKRGGVRAESVQRVAASSFPSRPRFFGHALSGGRDLSGDHLPDLAVGTWGQVIVLRSPPLLQVTLSVTWEPQVLAAAAPDCGEAEQLRAAPATAQLCFSGLRRTPDSSGPPISLDLHFRAELDPGRARSRAVFAHAQSAATNGSARVGEGRSCLGLRVRVQECPRDTLTPLGLRVTLGEALGVGEGPRPQLSPDSDTAISAALPFEHDCGADNLCQDDLAVALNFSGARELLVGAGQALEVTVTVTNGGESSFGTEVALGHPAELSYRKVTVIEARPRSGPVRCHSEPPRGQRRVTKCQVLFRVTLDVPSDAELGDSLEVVADVTSDNGGPGGRSQRAEISVRYQVLLLLASVPDSTRYVNVTAGTEPPPAPVSHHYQVQLLGSRAVPVNVTFAVPSRAGGQELWDSLGVTAEQELPRCRESSEPPQDPPGPQQRPLLGCPGSSCRTFLCCIPKSQPPKIWDFHLGGQLRLGWVAQPKVLLQSSAQLSFDRRTFQNTWGGAELQVQTELELLERPRPLPLILGASLGGLLLLALAALGLHKAGFFRRRYQELLREGEGQGAGPGQSPSPQAEGGAGTPPQN